MKIIDNNSIQIEDVVAIANQQIKCSLSTDQAFVNFIAAGESFIQQLIAEDGEVYGVTTGYGDSCTVNIPSHLVDELPKHLYTFHGCGMGRLLTVKEVRAVMVARLNSLAKGYSGVSYQLLQHIVLLLDKNIVPVIPEEGSVGASGDLTPLSYLAAVLCGEREVYYQGEIKPTAEVFTMEKITPLQLKPKEGLALMNGTAVMTGLACYAFKRAEYLSKLATRITAMASVACKGNHYHFDEKLFSVKPHKGQQQVAARLREDLQFGDVPRNSSRLQDRYSLRCAPHVIGVLEDSLPWLRQMIENELNSANDNPIIDAQGEHVLHGGHFYGGHIAMAMDSLKNLLANIADLLDRQLAVLVDVRFNHGLPANLSGSPEDRAAINHGFKAVQIAVSAWTAEALKNTMPASVFSRSTECHNQDKVSMGTIAARDCLRVLTLVEQVVSAMLMAVSQGVELRQHLDADTPPVSKGIQALIDQLRDISPALSEDRALDKELAQIKEMIETQQWPVYQS